MNAGVQRLLLQWTANRPRSHRSLQDLLFRFQVLVMKKN
jgi:hypothetical protein